jgi:hypothetical protein
MLHWHYAAKMAREITSFALTAGEKSRFPALREIYPTELCTVRDDAVIYFVSM